MVVSGYGLSAGSPHLAGMSPADSPTDRPGCRRPEPGIKLSTPAREWPSERIPLNLARRVVGKAFDQVEIGFRVADDIADHNLIRRHGEPYSSTLAANRLDEAAASQLVDDLHQVAFGNAVTGSDLGDRAENEIKNSS